MKIQISKKLTTKCIQCGGNMRYVETDEMGDYYECLDCDWDTHFDIE